MDIKKVIIVGAGASGLLAAYSASIGGKSVTVIEKNKIPGKKLHITGRGRCNLTNEGDIENIIANVMENGKFLYPSLSSFSPKEIIVFFNDLGLKTKTERGGRVFPVSDSARDVVDTLYKALLAKNVSFLFGVTVKGVITRNGKTEGIVTNTGEAHYCDSVIICTGGISYPKTGSTGDGYAIAKELGHTITQLRPGLVPVETLEKWVRDLMGLTLKNVVLSLYRDKKLLFSEMGEMIFTHFGISGPLVLTMSSYIVENTDNCEPLKICIDLKPALDHDTLDRRILRDFDKYKNRRYGNALNDLFPKKLIPVIIDLSGIDPEKEVNNITRDERKKLIEIIKGLELTFLQKRPVSEAIVTRGGISLDEINPRTLGSRIIQGLFFAGEVLDLDAKTGGYNLTIAFSTGYKAGMMS